MNKVRKTTITYFRRVTVILISLLFFLSYYFDIQILEGSLIGSRFVGFHLIDPFVTLEVFLISNSIPINLLIGTVIILLLYLLIGGRVFCSWVCPYGLISELGEKLHLGLLKKNIIKGDIDLPVGRYWFLLLWLTLAVVTGYLIFEVFNIMAITSRTIIYGFAVTSIIILPILLIEIFISRRLWCRSICPVGSIYGILNKISLGKVAWQGECNRCGKCIDICYDKKILEFVHSERADIDKPHYIKDTGCTLCLACADVCPNSCIKYRNQIKNIV